MLGYYLGYFEERVIHVPDSISKYLFFYLLRSLSELFQVIDVFLKILIEQLLFISWHVRSGSRTSMAFFSFYFCWTSPSED